MLWLYGVEQTVVYDICYPGNVVVAGCGFNIVEITQIMKIGFIAMSGVRAYNQELMKHGLTLPGFVERSKVIASMPSLSLLTLAALTPKDIEVEYKEINDLKAEKSLPDDYDLVAISSFSAQIYEAYELAGHYQKKGIKVVMGGLHVSVLPGEAKHHCTSVVIGEGEMSWPRVIEDFRRGQLKEYYHWQPGETFDMALTPVPRYELLDISRYNRLTAQTSRGCPHRCDFCASSILITHTYKVKPVESIINEIRFIKSMWEEPFIEFADDNSFVVRNHTEEFLRLLINEGIHWFTEIDISIAEYPGLLELMQKSGCRQVLIGLESPHAEGVNHIELRSNWKKDKFQHYEGAIHEIQSHGIAVNGCFILGLDGDTEQIFDRVYEFVDRTGLFEAQITVLTPFPGTPLYHRLRNEGRIVEDAAWQKCTLFDVNYIPKQMSLEALEKGIFELSKRIYDKSFIEERQRRFFRNLRHRKSQGSLN